ncbi:hypothetical protein [Cardiobacterium hominis]
MDKTSITMQILFEEEIFIRGMRLTSAGQSLSETRKKLLNHIREIVKTSDAPLMIATELANSRAMESSLQSAINEIEVIQRHFQIILTPDYALIDRAFSLPKNRQKGLPIDEARQSFRSHYARLANFDKSRLDDDEKEIIDARQEMFALAKSLYIAEQEIALGVAA